MKTLLVLAGGFGSRLRAAVPDVPKPLAPVCGKPFLMHLLENCVSQGADDIVFLLHFEAQKIEKILSRMAMDGLLDGVRTRTIIEKEPLGTGGSILNAIKSIQLEDSFIVINADTWLGTGIEEVANSKPPSLAAIQVQDCSRYGSLSIADKNVINFHEKKPFKIKGYINAGLYHLEPSIFSNHSLQDSFSLEEEIFPKLADIGKLGAVEIETEFIDIGVPDDYLRFCKWIEGGKNFGL